MKLSVCCITYNHAAFLNETITGFLSQRTNFEFEIIIADDCSVDDSRTIIKSFASKDDRIKLIENTQNIGMMANFIQALKACSGEYIAICDGDDYWTDEYKLQKQVEFLEANIDYLACWTQATYINIATGEEYLPESFRMSSSEALFYEVHPNFFYEKFATPTLTSVFRAKCLSNFDLSDINFFNDNVLFLTILGTGKGALLNFNAAVYRIHEGGAWSGANSVARKLNIFKAINTAMTIAPSLTKLEHLQAWRKWNVTQAFYLLAEGYSMTDFKLFSSLLFKVLQFQDKIERRKAIGKYLKTIYQHKWKVARLYQ